MSVSVTMPRLGESVTEGTVTRWLKADGDDVDVDEPLLEVSTDKVDTEIPSPASGVLSSIKVAEDETVDVGAELAPIDEGGQPVVRRPPGRRSAGAPVRDPPSPTQAAAPPAAPAPPPPPAPVTPPARRPRQPRLPPRSS